MYTDDENVCMYIHCINMYYNKWERSIQLEDYLTKTKNIFFCNLKKRKKKLNADAAKEENKNADDAKNQVL